MQYMESKMVEFMDIRVEWQFQEAWKGNTQIKKGKMLSDGAKFQEGEKLSQICFTVWLTTKYFMFQN